MMVKVYRSIDFLNKSDTNNILLDFEWIFLNF